MSAALGRGLRDLIDRGLSDHLFTGACYEVHWHGKTVTRGQRGRLSARSGFPVDRSTLFDMASLTKPLSTALCVLRLVADGRLALDTTLPEVCERLSAQEHDADPPPPLRCHRSLRQATVRHLLTHASGIAAWQSLYKQGLSRRESLQTILGAKPKHKPGTHYEYSCLGYIVLGEIVNALADRPLDQFARSEVHAPAGMKDTRYCLASSDRRRAAATELCPWRGKRAWGFVHDENAFSLGGVSGNAGLFSTARDVSRFCRTLLSPGQFGLPAKLFRAYTTNQLRDLGGHSSCGWFFYGSDLLSRPPGFSKRSFGHTGYTGTWAIFDPGNEGFAFLLTNRVYYGRDPERYTRYSALRRAFAEAVGNGLRALPGA